MAANNTHSGPIFISAESDDLRHIVNLDCINFIRVNYVNGELRSATITLNDVKNNVTIIGSQSVEQLLKYLEPFIKLDIRGKR